MPEPQLRPGRGQQAGFSQPVHHLWRAGGGPLKQPRLDRGTDQCRHIEHAARRRPKSRGPGQHRIAGGGRDPVQPGLQHLRDVERVSAGGLVQLGGIQAAAPGHDRHGPRRQREEFDPPGTSLHRELPESHPQRVVTASSSSWHVATIRTGSSRIRRARNRSRSRVASSAQWMSSMTTTQSPRCALSSPSRAVNRSSRGPCTRHSLARSPPSWPLRSRSAPSGRGVNSPSHAPQHQSASLSPAANSSSRADLPTPASPLTSTTRPSPRRASLAYSASDVSGSSRSSNAIPPVSVRSGPERNGGSTQ